MYQPVIIKGNHYGLTVFLDPERPFPELMEYLGTKIRDSAGFFRGAKMALSFEGRTLTPEETNQAVNTICENSEIKISCVIDTDKAREDFFRRVLEEEEEKTGGGNQADGEFYKGTLRSGQMLAWGRESRRQDHRPGESQCARRHARNRHCRSGRKSPCRYCGTGSETYPDPDRRSFRKTGPPERTFRTTDCLSGYGQDPHGTVV